VNPDLHNAVKFSDAEASLDEAHLYKVQLAVKAMVDFLLTSLERLGIDKFNELVNPSLDEIEQIIVQLNEEAKSIDEIGLQQVLLGMQIMIRDIKEKNPELCAQGAKFLKNALIFR